MRSATKAIDSRKAEVEQNGARPQCLDRLQRGRAVVSNVYRVTLHPQQHRHAFGGVMVVVDDQDGGVERRDLLGPVAGERGRSGRFLGRRRGQANREFAALVLPIAADRDTSTACPPDAVPA